MNTDDHPRLYQSDPIQDLKEDIESDPDFESIIHRMKKFADGKQMLITTPSRIGRSLFKETFLQGTESVDKFQFVPLEISEKEIQKRVDNEIALQINKVRNSDTTLFYIDTVPFVSTGPFSDSTMVNEHTQFSTYTSGFGNHFNLCNFNSYIPEKMVIECEPKEESEIAQLHRRKHGKVAVPKKKKKHVQTSSILDKLIRKVQK